MATWGEVKNCSWEELQKRQFNYASLEGLPLEQLVAIAEAKADLAAKKGEPGWKRLLKLLHLTALVSVGAIININMDINIDMAEVVRQIILLIQSHIY